jgi:CubicO group peptidase (beta-lactamase class C family)
MATFKIRDLKGTMNLCLKLLVAAGLGSGMGVALAQAQAQAQALTASQRLDRITRVENGLLPPFITANTQPMRLADRMQHYGVPGLSVAVVERGQLVWAQAWGVKQAGRPTPLTTDTQMQAASISKAVAAVAALRWVDQGKVGLDGDLNTVLRSWQIPPGAQTADKPVTLRRVLSHSAGLTVPGFLGYAPGAAVPTTLQILDGLPPANSAAVRVDIAPGSEWRYSGGGFVLVQQLLEDLSGQTFEEVLQRDVLSPAGMARSSFVLTAQLLSQTAVGHDKGQPIPGLRVVHPELAAAGLWTTPSDLARFAIALPQLLQASTLNEALKPQFGASGLGFIFQGQGVKQRYGHDGRNAGFDSRWLADPKDGGRSVVVMANANGAMPLFNELIRAIAQVQGWADWRAPTQAVLKAQLRTTPLYLRGSLNDWGLSLPMQPLARDRYAATVTLPTGRIEFKLATEDWANVDLGLASDRATIADQVPLTLAGANVPFDVTKPGRYRFEVDMGHRSGPRVRVKRMGA